jgi:hypothetical protein
MSDCYGNGDAWVMAMARRLAGDKEGKGEGGKGNGDNNEGGGQQRGQGRQGDGEGDKGGGQAGGDGNSNEEGDGNKPKIRGCRGRQ